ncbi:FadR/GntR family transcriptional regulator [Williamsia sterculiae]|uniref:DNA-binding transcriptional regulator, FadR family n=1 Tax=Williamsia sterculiae TaxID=1344003 RepID=A0A1N7H6I3_9NOCA|nr:FCD domain-containing protein [Williamsia sterculiae]SIS20466.1 DNA-binding transcriptional regulator, FadR family [Williamsia sterculiae]
MPLISPPPRTSSLVVDRMQHLISDGDWPVGSRIPAEPDLVTMFGVGRNTIREAVRALEHAGLLMPRRGDGTYVRSRNLLTEALDRCARGELVDLLSTRRALETEAAALAAERTDAAGIAELRELLTTILRARAEDDLDAHIGADLALHTAIVVASANPLLISLYDGIGELLRRNHPTMVGAVHGTDTHDNGPLEANKGPLDEWSARHPSTGPTTPSSGPNRIDGHRLVVDAIAAGDPAAAREAVHSYLDDAMEALR